jgi:hypothetical protein
MVKVLFDHNMPPAIARALHEVIRLDGHEAHALRDRFPQQISDIDYFTELGRDGDWIVISKDQANAKKRAERAAILRSGVLAFYLRPSVQQQPIHQQAATITWHWDKILQQRQLNERGLFELPVNKGSKFRAL